MQLKYTYGARSMLDQLSANERQEAIAAIDHIQQQLNQHTPPHSLMERVAAGQASDVYVIRVGNGWRVYFKLSDDELSVEDVVSKRQIEALRVPQ